MTGNRIEILKSITVTEFGTVMEEILVVCTMTGYRELFIIHHIGDGYYQSVSEPA